MDSKGSFHVHERDPTSAGMLTWSYFTEISSDPAVGSGHLSQYHSCKSPLSPHTPASDNVPTDVPARE